MRIARASSFIPEGEAEHRRKSTFRIGNIWIITSVRHTPSGQQRYFIEIVNRYRGLAVASRHVGILYAVTTPVSSVIFPGRRRRPFQPDTSSRRRNYVFIRMAIHRLISPWMKSPLRGSFFTGYGTEYSLESQFFILNLTFKTDRNSRTSLEGDFFSLDPFNRRKEER